MAPAGLLVLLQYGVELTWLPAGLTIVGTLVFVLILLALFCREERRPRREDSSDQSRPSREVAERWARRPEEAAVPSLPRFFRSPSSSDWKLTDAPSSPIGGSCLACGATVTEETSISCPACGAERQRCPICQRHVAGGQDLLACIYCHAPGHANEMRAWVEQHETCPYCSRRIGKDALEPPQERLRGRRRKP
jgi:hypothetical protein